MTAGVSSSLRVEGMAAAVSSCSGEPFKIYTRPPSQSGVVGSAGGVAGMTVGVSCSLGVEGMAAGVSFCSCGPFKIYTRPPSQSGVVGSAKDESSSSGFPRTAGSRDGVEGWLADLFVTTRTLDLPMGFWPSFFF